METPTQTHEALSTADVAAQMGNKIAGAYGAEAAAHLAPVIDFVAAAHEGITGSDGLPLALHCADVTTALTRFTPKPTLEQMQLGLLHDAATAGYSAIRGEDNKLDSNSFVRQARAAGCSEKVIAAAFCFARPNEQQGWRYDDWVSYLMRDDLTRVVKAADSQAAIDNFPPQSESQLEAWTRTRDRLAQNLPEPPEVTARIAQSLQAHELPDITESARPHLAAAA